MKRRDFVQHTTLTSTALAVSPGLLTLKKKKHIGVQLYSVRDDMKKDAIGTLTQVSVMGYREVEGYGYWEGKYFGMTPAEYKLVLGDLGLEMPTAHYGMSLQNWKAEGGLTDSTRQAVADAALLGHKVFICPYIDRSQRDEESVKKLCDIFNHVAELCKEHGMSFGYHNHDFEFQQAGDMLIYDHILQRTDPDLVKMQLDIYWAVYAHQDPVTLFKKSPGRFVALHVKDMADTPERETVEVGEGVINFKEIFESSKLGGVEYYVVELEHYKRTPLEGIEVCLHNLTKLLA